MTILDFLVEAQNQIRFAASVRIALEALLLRIIRTHQRIPVDFLVKRLIELEKKLQTSPQTSVEEAKQSIIAPTQPIHQPTYVSQSAPQEPLPPKASPSPILQQVPITKPTEKPIVPPSPVKSVSQTISNSMSIDPTPSAADLGKKAKPVTPVEPIKPISAIEPKIIIKPEQQRRYDTLLQFAAIELEGTIQKKQRI